ncbi:MAG: hypothetical protein QME51_09205, partial [Planctomycetota bacterium]|nr:hypothetical protein [Planctomycetota bacterium]
IVEIPAQGSVTYSIKIENDGNVPMEVTLTASPEVTGKWSVTYYNGLDTTAEVITYSDITSGSGWLRPGNIAVGGEVYICVEIKADASALGGVEGQYINYLRVISTLGASVVSDTIRSRTEVQKIYRADGGISTDAGGPFLDMSITETDGASQKVTQGVLSGGTATYYIRLENDGNPTDSFSITATGGVPDNWIVTYYDAEAGGQDITSDMTITGYVYGPISPIGWAPSHFRIIRAQITAVTTIPNAVYTIFVRTNSQGAGFGIQNSDTVRGEIIVSEYKPDLRLDTISNGEYITGNNLYAYTDPPLAGQAYTHYTKSNETITYYVKIENDGSNDTFSLTASPEVSDWLVSYYDAVSADITILMRQGAYTTTTIPLGGSITCCIEVTPTSAPPSTTLQTYFYQYSTNLVDRYDALGFNTVVKAFYVDNWIKCSTDTDYTGIGITNTTGAGQTVTNTLINSATVTYNIVIENDGNVAETFSLTATGGGNGWTVSYYDGVGDITADILQGNYTIANLSPAASSTIRVEVIASDRFNLQGGSVITNTITSTCSSDEVSKQDVVKCETTLITDYTVDGRIALSPLYDNYQGGNSYNIDGAGQTDTVMNIPAEGTITYSIKIENDGNVPTPITISGSLEVTGKWTVTYYNDVAISPTAIIPYNEITSEAGWLRPGSIAAGQDDVYICVEMKPDASVFGGSAGQYTNYIRTISSLNQNIS